MDETAITTNADKIHQVLQWCISGHSAHDIIDAAQKQWPGTQSQPLIIAAMKQLANAGQADESIIRGWAVESTREIYRRAMDVGDLQTALRAAKQMHDLVKK